MLTVWFNGGMKESPEEMGEICEKLIYTALEAHRGPTPKRKYPTTCKGWT